MRSYWMNSSHFVSDPLAGITWRKFPYFMKTSWAWNRMTTTETLSHHLFQFVRWAMCVPIPFCRMNRGLKSDPGFRILSEKWKYMPRTNRRSCRSSTSIYRVRTTAVVFQKWMASNCEALRGYRRQVIDDCRVLLRYSLPSAQRRKWVTPLFSALENCEWGFHSHCVHFSDGSHKSRWRSAG